MFVVGLWNKIVYQERLNNIYIFVGSKKAKRKYIFTENVDQSDPPLVHVLFLSLIYVDMYCPLVCVAH